MVKHPDFLERAIRGESNRCLKCNAELIIDLQTREIRCPNHGLMGYVSTIEEATKPLPYIDISNINGTLVPPSLFGNGSFDDQSEEQGND